MCDIYCYSYVEDAPSAAVAEKLVAARNAQTKEQLLFRDGFPLVTGGCDAIKKKCQSFVKMAQAGIHTFTLTDLDTQECAGVLIRDWFALPESDDVSLPDKIIFRVAVREVESWILADHVAWAKHVAIPSGNFSVHPERLSDPKQHLLNVIRKKGTKKVHREMLPTGSASIGPRYNEVLCRFINKKWSPKRAAKNSPSLARAIEALLRI